MNNSVSQTPVDTPPNSLKRLSRRPNVEAYSSSICNSLKHASKFTRDNGLRRLFVAKLWSAFGGCGRNGLVGTRPSLRWRGRARRA